VFSGASPLLDVTLTRASGEDGGGCAGSGVRDRYDLTLGTNPDPADGDGEQAAAGRYAGVPRWRANLTV